MGLRELTFKMFSFRLNIRLYNKLNKELKDLEGLDNIYIFRIKNWLNIVGQIDIYFSILKIKGKLG